MKLNFIFVNTEAYKDEVRDILDACFEFECVQYDVASTVFDDNIYEGFLGYQPANYVDLVVKPFANVWDPHVRWVIITSQPIAYNSRIYISKAKNVALITLKGVAKEGSVAGLAIQLYYAATLLLDGVLDGKNCDNPCFYDHFSYVSFCNEFCIKCIEQLGDEARVHKNKLATVKQYCERLDRTQHILITHGIYSTASWGEQLNRFFVRNGMDATVIRYDFTYLINLLLNKFFIGKAVTELYEAYNYVRKTRPHQEVSVVAHSHGTLAFSKLFETYPDVSLDKIIFVGSIVCSNYDWSSLIRNGRVSSVLNECGDRDLAVAFAECIPGTGVSGVSFFSRSNDRIHNRMHKSTGHSGLLKRKDVWEKDWLPFILGVEPLSNFEEPKCSKRVALVLFANRVLLYIPRFIGKVLSIFKKI